MMYLRKGILIENKNLKRWLSIRRLSIIVGNLFLYKYKRFILYLKIIVKEENLYHLNIPNQLFFEIKEDTHTITKINEITKSLTDEYKVPYLMYAAGYKYREIAETLNVPIGIVKSRIFYAHYRLRSKLTNQLL